MTLLSILKKKESELAANTEEIKKKVTPILEQIITTFPEYTPHNIEHKKRVLAFLDMIIPDNLKEKLNPYEIYFLICATYVHDLGMVKFDDEIEKKTGYNDSRN